MNEVQTCTESCDPVLNFTERKLFKCDSCFIKQDDGIHISMFILSYGEILECLRVTIYDFTIRNKIENKHLTKLYLKYKTRKHQFVNMHIV